MSNRISTGANVAAAMLPSRRDIAVGVAAILTATAVWGSWIVITRFGVTTSLSPYDAAFLRFAIPSVILLPVLLRDGLALRRIGVVRTILIVAGAGAPAFLISTSGMRFAPAAHAGALLPGTMPLFVAVLAVLIERERISASRLAGFALIIAGVLAIGGYSLFASQGGEWRGHVMFLTAALMWAVYTLAFRSAGIGPWHAAAVINFWSIVGFAPVYLFGLEFAPVRRTVAGGRAAGGEPGPAVRHRRDHRLRGGGAPPRRRARRRVHVADAGDRRPRRHRRARRAAGRGDDLRHRRRQPRRRAGQRRGRCMDLIAAELRTSGRRGTIDR